MIEYKNKGIRILSILFRCKGSVVPLTLPVVLFSCTICFVTLYFNFNKVFIDGNYLGGGDWMLHPAPFSYFLQFAAFLLTFHTNAAFNRFWEARTNLQSMSSYWSSCASMLIGTEQIFISSKKFSKQQKSGAIKAQARILQLLSTLHATGLRYLLNESKVSFEVLGGLPQHEAQVLRTSEDPLYLVMHWLSTDLLLRQHFGGLPTPPPLLTRAWHEMTLGLLAYDQACKVQDTPFPFPYLQMLYIIDLGVIVLVPVVVSCWVQNLYMSLLLVAMIVFSFHSIFQAAYLMETPFGLRPNDLNLLDLHKDFLSRLRVLVSAELAWELNDMMKDFGGPDGADRLAQPIVQEELLEGLAATEGLMFISKNVEIPSPEKRRNAGDLRIDKMPSRYASIGGASLVGDLELSPPSSLLSPLREDRALPPGTPSVTLSPPPQEDGLTPPITI